MFGRMTIETICLLYRLMDVSDELSKTIYAFLKKIKWKRGKIENLERFYGRIKCLNCLYLTSKIYMKG